MKSNFHDATNAAATAIKTGEFAFRDAIGDLRGVERNISELSRMSPVNPRDFLHQADVVANPQAEIADLKSDLRTMLNNLAKAEVHIAELRAFLKSLLE